MPKRGRIRTKPIRRRGLKRPKAALSFQLAPTTSSLARQVHLITHLIRRNKNQHRSQPFFKHLCIFRRTLSRLSDIHTALASATPTNTSTSLTAESVRQRFETEASLRAQRDVCEEHIREVTVPKCYVAFGAVVADTQFANLGVVLIGVLADAFALVGGPSVKDEDEDIREGLETGTDKRQGEPILIQGTSTKATGEDWGEVVERVYEATDSDGCHVDEFEVEGEGSKVDNSSSHRRLPDPSKHINTEAGMDIEGNGGMKNKEISTSEKTHEQGSNRLKKRKRKGKSAIDDLFEGLL